MNELGYLWASSINLRLFPIFASNLLIALRRYLVYGSAANVDTVSSEKYLLRVRGPQLHTGGIYVISLLP